MNKLKFCPFCGSEAGIQQDITGKKWYHVVCNNPKSKCPMGFGMPWRNTPKEAADDWNRRADGWIPVASWVHPGPETEVLTYSSRAGKSFKARYSELKECRIPLPLPEPPGEVKKCPFCGGEAKISIGRFKNGRS